MIKHPQLRSFLEGLQAQKRRVLAFKYGDGHKAALSVNAETVTVTTDNPALARTLGLILEKILSGDLREAIDKNEK